MRCMLAGVNGSLNSDDADIRVGAVFGAATTEHALDALFGQAAGPDEVPGKPSSNLIGWAILGAGDFVQDLHGMCTKKARPG